MLQWIPGVLFSSSFWHLPVSNLVRTSNLNIKWEGLDFLNLNMFTTLNILSYKFWLLGFYVFKKIPVFPSFLVIKQCSSWEEMVIVKKAIVLFLASGYFGLNFPEPKVWPYSDEIILRLNGHKQFYFLMQSAVMHSTTVAGWDSQEADPEMEFRGQDIY